MKRILIIFCLMLFAIPAMAELQLITGGGMGVMFNTGNDPRPAYMLCVNTPVYDDQIVGFQVVAQADFVTGDKTPQFEREISAERATLTLNKSLWRSDTDTWAIYAGLVAGGWNFNNTEGSDEQLLSYGLSAAVKWTVINLAIGLDVLTIHDDYDIYYAYSMLRFDI